MQRMHTHFSLGFFVTVENKRFVNPTPKRKVARWNRAGGTSFLSNQNLSPETRSTLVANVPTVIQCGVIMFVELVLHMVSLFRS
jgi:hypothetical protein